MPDIERASDIRQPTIRRRWRRMLGWTALVLDHLKPVRVSLLIVAVAVVVAIGVDQAAELFLIALWTDPSEARYVALLLSSALAGLAHNRTVPRPSWGGPAGSRHLHRPRRVARPCLVPL